MYCPKCGKLIDDSSIFCNYCGSQVNEKIEQETVSDNNQSNVSFVEESSQSIPSTQNDYTSVPKKKNWVLRIGMILAIIGIVGFLAIALVGLIVWGKVYLYDGYNFTKVLCTLCIAFMILGSCGLVVGLLLSKNKAPEEKKNIVFSIILIILAVIFSVILIVNGIENENGKKQSSSNSSYSTSYEMDHATYCLLYMEVSNVKVTHSGNYAYITGTVTNTGTYKIRYVKVRAACKNYLGTIIDTDWTYAVDSSWLNPGESKTFQMMVRDSENNIRTADVTVVYD